MEEEKKEIVVVDNEQQGIELSSDKIVELAENAEKRIEAVNKIKQMALRVTNSNDWVDMGGKPYLQSSGAEKIARLFGICWQIEEPTIEYDEDGHFTYTYKGTFTLIKQGVSIEAVGTRSSRDPLFSKSHGKDIPPSEISKADVKKSAYTNLTANGITRLLGIRNLSWDDVKNANISITQKVEYKKAGEKAKVQGNAKCNFCQEAITSAEAEYSTKNLYESLCRKHQTEKKTLLGNIPLIQQKKNINDVFLRTMVEEVSGKTCKVKELSLRELQELSKLMEGGEK